MGKSPGLKCTVCVVRDEGREKEKRCVTTTPCIVWNILEMRFGESDPAESIQSTKNHTLSHIYTHIEKPSGISCWPHNSCFL